MTDESDNQETTATQESAGIGAGVPQAMRERRIHLRAFDYWEGLRGDRIFPLFDDLKSTDLEEFKDCCLLLDVSQDRGGIIRFVGARIDQLIDAPIMVGVPLSAFPHASFAAALVDQLSDEQDEYRAVEFEFIEDVTDSRGILLPFTKDGDGQENVQFVMVVANFRTRVPDVIMPLDDEIQAAPEVSPALAAEPDSDFGRELARTQSVADEVVHPNGGTREGLYRALEKSYQLYFDAQSDETTYLELLKSEGLKVQKRAPFTPLLKLVFGKTYDKTRITEYATALAYAERCGIEPADITDFLMDQPGGIKGCVRAERRARREQLGNPAHDRQAKAIKTLREVKAKATVELKVDIGDQEFTLLLARTNSQGGADIIGPADVSKETLDAIIRRYAAKN